MSESALLAEAIEKDVPLEETLVTKHANWVQSMSFSPTARSLLTGSNDGSVRVSDPGTGETRLEIRGDFGGQVYATLVTPTSDAVIVACGDGKVYVYDTETVTGPQKEVRLSARLRRTMESHGSNAVLSLAISKDGGTLVSGSVGRDIIKHDLKSGEETGRFVGHEGYVYSLAISRDNTLLASGSGDETVRVWSLKDCTCIHTLTDHIGWVWGVDFHPKRDILASGSNDRTICLWNPLTGELLQKIETFEHVYCVQYAPVTGRFLLCGTSGEKPLRIYDMEKNYSEHVITSTKQGGRVFSVAFSSSESAFAAGSEDGQVVLFRPKAAGSTANAARRAPTATQPIPEDRNANQANTKTAQTPKRTGGFCANLCACFGGGNSASRS
jgi:WD40 repeat protein